MKSSWNRARKQYFYANYFCNRFANECGGFWTGACSGVESGQVKLPGGDERSFGRLVKGKREIETQNRRREAAQTRQEEIIVHDNWLEKQY